VNALLRLVRSQLHVYSEICKARLFYSRYIAARRERVLYRRQRSIFAMTELERRHCDELRNLGFTMLHGFFGAALADTLLAKADSLFRKLLLDPALSYSVQNRERASFEGLGYQTLERTEKMIALKDPLVNVPECIPIAFHETVLKIVTNFLGYVIPRFKPLIVRDFPTDRPRESSFFHRDNDEADSVQAFVYLVDIDETIGPLIYVPRTNRYDVQSCRPRLSRDLGVSGYDGRISDEEVLKYYPRESWVALRAKRGTLAIFHGNGFHKGPVWPRYGDPGAPARTAVRMDFHGYKLGQQQNRWKQSRIRSVDYARLSRLQRLFTDESAVVD